MAVIQEQKLTDETLTAHAQARFNESKNWVEEKILPSWIEENDLYDSKFPTASEKSQSDVLVGQGKLFIPKTYSHTQRMVIDVMDTVFFDAEELVDITTWKNIPTETLKLVKTLLNYRLNNKPIQFYHEALEAVQDALRNKVGIFKVWPDIKTEDSTDDQGNKTKKIKSYSPQMSCLKYEDVYFSPRATWKDYWKYTIIHRMESTKDYLQRRGYKNLDQIETPAIYGDSDMVKAQRSLDQGSPFSGDGTITAKDDKVYIFEIWTHLDVNGDGLLESCSYLMAGTAEQPKIIISDVKENDLPYRFDGEDYTRPPILVGQAFPESHKMYGKSLPGIVRGLQRETNSLRNQRREAVALMLRRPTLVSRAAGIDMVGLVNRRIGGVVLGDDISPSSIREMDMSDPTQTTVQEQAKTDSDFYETTSISPDRLGVQDNSGTTATEVTAHEGNANKKINHVIKNIAQTLFIPAFRFLLRLEQEYESDEFIALVTGRVLGWGWSQDAKPLRKFIQGEFDLIANMGLNKQMQINRLFLMMDRANMANTGLVQMLQAGVVKPEDAQFINTMTFFNRSLPLLGEKNIKEFQLQAQAPPPQPGMGGGAAPGIASQTGLVSNPQDILGGMNPQGLSING